MHVCIQTQSGERMCASNLRFYIHVRRKPKFFLFNIVLPIIVLSAVTLTVFWLPAGSGEKVGLAVSVLLSFTLFMLVVSNILPRTSESTPLLSESIYMKLDLNESYCSQVAHSQMEKRIC